MENEALYEVIDTLIYQYFGLSDDEISIVEDTVNYIIPASQLHQNTIPHIWVFLIEIKKIRSSINCGTE